MTQRTYFLILKPLLNLFPIPTTLLQSSIPHPHSSSRPSLAFDLGASSGRAIVGIPDGDAWQLHEVHRFPTHLLEDGDRLFWDLPRIEAELDFGLEEALRHFPAIKSLSVTAWGVDYLPLDAKLNPLRNAYCYRDTRKDGMMAKVHAIVPKEEIYRLTGIQFMEINTIYQLYTDKILEPEVMDAAHLYLTVSDYLNFRMGGKPVIEVSQASTTQMLDATTRTWAKPLFDKLGLPYEKWPEVVPSGTVIGHHPKYPNIQVIAGLSHDTGAAVAGVPAKPGSNWCYISSGTWSLLGAELQEPDLSDAACEASFTNEAGFGGTIRFLKNITGLWVLQECEREWRERDEWPGYDALIDSAKMVEAPYSAINLNEPQFGTRGNMVEKITSYCEQTRQKIPQSQAEIACFVIRSLARHYRETLEVLERLRNTRYDVIHIVGGGSKNSWLCELTEEETGRKVIAGPVEATALGNLMIQNGKVRR
jgi:rhamnulokinase